MRATPPARASGLTRAAAAARTGERFDARPVRVAHLGLGAFHRSHQAWYTDVADDEEEWGIRAFTGRSPRAAADLASQGGLYSLAQRSGDGDEIGLVRSITDAVDGGRVDLLAATLSSPATALVTMTITEAGYTLNRRHELDRDNDSIVHDLTWLRDNLPSSRLDFSTHPRTSLARLLVGLEARRRRDAGPIAVVSCDNLPDNSQVTRRGLRSLAELAGATATLGFLDEQVSFVSTSVDRITPKATQRDIDTIRDATGWDDRAAIVTEPFHDWVLSGSFPAGRPAWERAGARIVDDIEPFERRKLWLLNGAHSLVAYAGIARGHPTVATAIADPTIRIWVDEFWDEAERHLPSKDLDLVTYRRALLERFDNARIQHLLTQIGHDGAAKLRVRVVPVLLAERAAGRVGAASSRTLAAWVALIRAGRLPADGFDQKLRETVRLPAEAATTELLRFLDPRLPEVHDTVAAVSYMAREISANQSLEEK